MLRAIAIIAVIMFALTGVTLAASKTKRTAHVLSGEVVSIDAAAGTVTVKADDPKELSQLKEGDKIIVRHARAKAAGKTSTPAGKSETMPMEKPMPTPK